MRTSDEKISPVPSRALKCNEADERPIAREPDWPRHKGASTSMATAQGLWKKSRDAT